jgi:hypothetical protein
MPFLCECRNPECTELILLDLRQYAEIGRTRGISSRNPSRRLERGWLSAVGWLGGGRTAGIVLDERLRSGNLVHDHLIVSPNDCALELRCLVAGLDDEPIILRTDALVNVQGHPHPVTAAAFFATFAEELDNGIRRPRPCLMPELLNPLVHLAEQSFVARLSGHAGVKLAQTGPTATISTPGRL